MTEPAESITVAVVEDHPLFRAAVARVLAEVPDFTVAATAESVAQFAAARLEPGAVVILDLKLRGVGDAAAVMQVVGMGHRVLVVSAHAGQDEVLGAIGAGAKGYLTKDTDGAEIIRAVREVAAGNSYVTPTLASFLLNASLGRSAGPEAGAVRTGKGSAVPGRGRGEGPGHRRTAAHQRPDGTVAPGPDPRQDRPAQPCSTDPVCHRAGHRARNSVMRR